LLASFAYFSCLDSQAQGKYLNLCLILIHCISLQFEWGEQTTGSWAMASVPTKVIGATDWLCLAPPSSTFPAAMTRDWSHRLGASVQEGLLWLALALNF